MALTDKDILITPNRGQTADPKIEFKGADATLGAQTISLNVYPTDNGTVSFEGSAGQLFSITNTLSGTIYSVNDVSGIPSIEVLDTGVVKLGQYGGNILLGSATDDGIGKLQINGTFTSKNTTSGSKLFRLEGNNTKYLYGYSDSSGTGITNSDPYTSGSLLYFNGTIPTIYSGSSIAAQFNGTSVRSSTFYDYDNTAYYIDAASTSNLNGLTVAGTITGSVSGTAASETLATVTSRGNSTSTNIGSTSGTALNFVTAGNVGTWIGGIQDATTGWSLGQATIGFKSDNTTYAAIGIGTANGLLYFGRTTASGVGTMSSWLEVNSSGVANFKLARPQHNASNLALVSEILNGTLGVSIGTAGATNTTVTWGTSTGFSANTASNLTYDLKVGPALTALASTMTGATTGFIKKSAADTYTLDTNTYLTGNQSISLTGDTTGSGTTSITTTTSYISSSDDRTKAPADDTTSKMRYGFTSWNNNNTSPYADYLHLRSYTDSSGGNDNLVMFRKDAIGMRIWQQTFGSSTAYATYKDVAFTDQLPTVNNGTLTLGIGTAGATNTTVTIGTGTGFSANTASNLTYDIKVGPALTNLATLMTTAGAGFIRRGATADTYTIDTNTYLTGESDTLATVTGRGASTATAITLTGGLNINSSWEYFDDWDRDAGAAKYAPNSQTRATRWQFANASTANSGGNYAGVLHFHPWSGTTASTGDASYQLSFGSTAANGGGVPKLSIRKGIDTTWNSWYTIPLYDVNSYSSALYATIYYDADDTNYYGNFAATGDNALRVRGGALFGPNTSWSSYLMVGGDGRQNYTDNTTTASVATTNGNLHIDAASTYSTYINWYDGTDFIVGAGDSTNTRLKVYGSSNYTYMSGSSRAPIFYDSDDTAYYTDPASTSRVNLVKANAVYDSATTRSILPSGASYTTSTASPTGSFKIKLPNGSKLLYPMLAFTVEIYNYSTSTSRTYRIGGHFSATAWYNVFAYCLTDNAGSLDVRFGYDASDSMCVWIGETTTTWAYPQVFVTDFQNGYSAIQDSWFTGWSITLVTSFDTVTNGPYTPALGLNSRNYNSYSPTLTGTGASGTWGISISGNAATATSASNIDGVAFNNSNSTNPVSAPDTLDSNGIGYVTNISLFSQTDGALHSQAYSSSWQHQIYGDYRTGQIAVRGKNNGTWQAWRSVLDSTNYTTWAATSGHNHTYNVNDAWLRDNGDDANVKLYGNSRQMAFRTDGTTEYATGVGGYPFAWMYGGDAAGNRLMLLNTSGDLWTSTNGWLSTALAGKQAAGSYLTAESDTLASVTGRGFTTRSSSGAFATNTQGTPGLEIYGAGTTEPAYMTFHRPGIHAVRFGLDGTDLKVGGWSMGNVAYKMWHEGNLTNLNQLTNGPGYITGESDTLATVTARGNTATSASIAYFGVNNTTNTNGYGISLYNGAVAGQPTYGLMFQGTATFGTHGGVTADWATYFTMNNTAGRGWVFRDVSTPANVASITNAGLATFNDSVRSPIFYDSADTGYYWNPNTSSAHRLQTPSGYLDLGPMNASFSHFQTDRPKFYFNKTLNVDGEIQIYGDTNTRLTQTTLVIRGTSPTIYLRDTDNNVAMLHNNSNLFYILRGATDSESWTQVGSYWPVYWDLTNNNATFGGSIWAASSVTAYSDIKLKENIITVDNALEKTLKLRGVYYTRKDDELKERRVGVIAQEIKEVLPEVVRFHQDEEDKEGTYAVDYGNITGLLIEAIKEQQSQIEELKFMINTLLARNKE